MIQSVSRAVDILRCFETRELLGITEIAEMSGLNKSTAFGIVASLAAEGLLEQDSYISRYRFKGNNHGYIHPQNCGNGGIRSGGQKHP